MCRKIPQPGNCAGKQPDETARCCLGGQAIIAADRTPGSLADSAKSDYAPMRNVAELLVPAIRWDTTTGLTRERDRIARALELGVGGFVIHGGPEAEVRGLIKDIRQASKIPLLMGAELERGVGQQFSGTTGLPPLAAITALNDPNLVQRAAKTTAREARPLGVNWG